MPNIENIFVPIIIGLVIFLGSKNFGHGSTIDQIKPE
jgi:hypothetical protein